MLEVVGGFFFFKQKTAYEMRISDWSSDVCSSDQHGLWMDSGRMPLRPSLRGRAIGLVGMGAIGRAVADRLAPFGMTLRWWAPRDKPECPLPRAASLADLARESEALILCRSEEHTSELQSLMRISYAVFCLKKKKQ